MREPVRIVLLLLVLATFWAAYFTERHLQTVAKRTGGETTRPFVLNGLLLRLDRNVSPRLTVDPQVRRRVAIVTSDHCRYSWAAVRPFVDFLGTMSFDGSIEVLAITMDGDEIPRRLIQDLSARSIKHRLIRVTNRSAFGQETGIAWTPEILALDVRWRVRLAAPQPDTITLMLLRRYFDER